MSSPFGTIINTVGTLSPGHIVLATEWNTAVGGIYGYINNTLLAGLNVVSAKGDLYVCDGSALQALGVGIDGKVLVANSGVAKGMAWQSIANLTTLTTKGDILGYDVANARVPVGTDGQVLTAASSDAQGVVWADAPGVPLGGIILWDTSKRAIPAGYNVCDGGTYNTYVTPNMQGLFLVGAGNGVNAPATNGMGNVACGTTAGDTSAGAGLGPQHNHTVPLTVVSVAGPGTNVGVGLASSVATGQKTVTPRYGALMFIMRTA